MGYNTVKDIQNKSRRRKNERQVKREKEEKLVALLEKNKQEELPGTNLTGLNLVEGDIKKLW